MQDSTIYQQQRKRVARARSFILSLLAIVGRLNAQEENPEPTPDTLTGQRITRMKIEEQGVQPFAVWTSEIWGNVSGGLKTTVWYNQLLEFGVNLDTAKLGWWEGGSFLVQAHWVENIGNGECFEDFTGAFNPGSSIMAGDHIRVFNHHYRHAWRDDAVVLKIGQIAADDDFIGSDYAGLFLNSAFGAMPSQVGTPLATSCGNPTAFPIYSVAAPGVFLHVRPFKAVYTQIGLYYGRPGHDETSNYGFDWTDQTPAELGLFWESGFNYRLARRPATLRFGLSYHTGPLDDFSGTFSGTAPATSQSVPNFYVIHDWQLLGHRDGTLKLGAFARAGLTPEPHLSMVSAYIDGGFNWFAPFPGRQDDVAGVAVSYTRFGDEFRDSIGPDGIARDETTLELTYKAQVNPLADDASGRAGSF